MTVAQLSIGSAVPLAAYARALSLILGIALAPGLVAAQRTAAQRVAADLGISWIEVEGGTFVMGTGNETREVTVESFFMSATEVTFDQYDAFCDAMGKPKPGDNGWGRGSRPVMYVSYDDAVEFADWLSRETGSIIRLPTEAEWEYAAAGGRSSNGYVHSGGNDKDEVSWNEDNSGGRTHPVGTKRANELGLFDMSGNLWEWCADSPETDADGPRAATRNAESDLRRPVRGDSFDNPNRLGFRMGVRLERDSRHLNIGFRVAKSPN